MKRWLLTLLLCMIPALSYGQAIDRTHLDYINPLQYGATCSAATLNATISAIGSSAKTVLITATDRSKVDCTWTLSDNVTFHANTTVYISTGVVLSPNVTKTVTFNGYVEIDDPDNSLAGAGSFVFNKKNWQDGCIPLKLYGTTFAIAWPRALSGLPSAGGCVDARMLAGPQTLSSTVAITKSVKLLLGGGTYTYAGASYIFDLQTGSNDVIIEGLGQTNTILKSSGTAGTEIGVGSSVSSTALGSAAANLAAVQQRANRLILRNLTIQGSGSSTTPGTVGTIGVYLDSMDFARLENVAVRNWGTGIKVENPNNTTDPGIGPGTGYYGQFMQVAVFYNATSGYNFTRGANSYNVKGGRVAGNAVNAIIDESQNITFDSVSFEVAGGTVNTNIIVEDDTSFITFIGNRFETSKEIQISGSGQGVLFVGNYASGGHADAVVDTSSTRSTFMLDAWSSLGMGTQGRSTPPSPPGLRDIVSNGSFTYDFGNTGIATNWSEISPSGGTHDWQIANGGKCGGVYQRLENTDHEDSRIAQDIPVTIGNPYTVSYFGFQVGNTGNVGVKVGTVSEENAYANMKTQGNDTNWRHAWITITPTESTLRIILFSANDTAVEAGWDCLSVTPGLWPMAYEEPDYITATVSVAAGTVDATSVKNVALSNMVGAVVGQIVNMTPAATPATGAGFIGAHVSATGVIQATFVNPTGSGVAVGTVNHTLQIFKAR